MIARKGDIGSRTDEEVLEANRKRVDGCRNFTEFAVHDAETRINMMAEGYLKR